MVVRHSSGAVDVIAASTYHPLIERLDDLFETGGYEQREMVDAEVDEWQAAREVQWSRGGPGDYER